MIKKTDRNYEQLYKDLLNNNIEEKEAKHIVESLQYTDETGITYTPEEIFKSLFSAKHAHTI